MHHEVTAPRPVGAAPLRVGFASDFHAGPTTAPTVLRDACDALAAARLDILLLGGDFVSVRARYIGPLARMIEDIPAPLGKFGVLGNHDLRANVEQVVDALEHVGVELLTNRARRLADPHGDVTVVGLDDPIHGDPDAAEAFGDADETGGAGAANAAGTRLLLMHAPDGLLHTGDCDFAIAMAGHTHGGQIRLPWGGPIVVPSGRLSRRYVAGLYPLDNGGAPRALLVSHGVGCSTVPVRLFARPQVHIVTLVAAPLPR
jgi:uncharacterized protein